MLLVALCGLPGSGKSTLCAALAAKASEAGVECHTVSFDAWELRHTAHGADFDAAEWKVRAW